MRLLIVDTSGDGLLDLAYRAHRRGHQVKYALQSYDPHKRPVGKGLVELIPDFHPWVNWADLILMAGNGRYMREADSWRERGIPVIGGGVESASWELDRLKGMEVLQRAKVVVPGYQHCRTIDDAISCVEQHGEGVAVKPSGDIADKSLSVVGKTAKEVLWNLRKWKREGKAFPQGLIVQERLEGVEFAVGAWFGPNGFADGIEENFEEKRLFAGALGPNCGEAGTVMRLVNKSKLFDKVLKPVEEQLNRIGYVGNADVNCIVDADGNAWPLEFTMRFGYPAINIELALHQSDPIEFLACVALGEKPPPRLINTIAVGVVLAIPPYPFGHERVEETVNVPIWGVTPGIDDNLHLCDVAMVNGDLATAGSYVLVATGTAETVVGARNIAHRCLNRLTIPASPFWRNDIGTRIRAQLPKLQEHGYAMGMVYA